MRDPIIFPSTSLGVLRGEQTQFDDGNVNQQLVFGANRTFVFPGGYYTRVLNISYHVDFGAAVANRYFGHRIDDGANPYLIYHAPSAWAANSNSNYAAQVDLIATMGFNGAAAELGPLPNVWFPGAWRLSTDVLNLSTGAPQDHVFSFRVLYETITQDEICELYSRMRKGVTPNIARRI